MTKHTISFDNPRARLILRNANRTSYKLGRIGLYLETTPGTFDLLEVVPTKEKDRRKTELEKEHNRQIIASYGTPKRL